MSGSMFDQGNDLATDVDWSAGIIPGTTSQADPGASGVAGSAGVAVGLGTGQQGISPVTGTGGGMNGAVQHVWQWLNTPFTTPLDAVQITLIVGVVLVAAVIWNLVLYHIRIAAETI